MRGLVATSPRSFPRLAAEVVLERQLDDSLLGCSGPPILGLESLLEYGGKSQRPGLSRLGHFLAYLRSGPRIAQSTGWSQEIPLDTRDTK